MLRERRECDVYGTAKGILNVEVAITLSPTDEELNLAPATEKFKPADLSPRGLERLKKFIARGLTAPLPRRSPDTDI